MRIGNDCFTDFWVNFSWNLWVWVYRMSVDIWSVHTAVVAYTRLLPSHVVLIFWPQVNKFTGQHPNRWDICMYTLNLHYTVNFMNKLEPRVIGTGLSFSGGNYITTLGICCATDLHSSPWDDSVVEDFFYTIHPHLHLAHWPCNPFAKSNVRNMKWGFEGS